MENNKDLFGPEFIRSLLLMLEQTDYKQYMENPSVVIKRADSDNTKREGIDKLIKFFEEQEEFEKCANLQKIKAMLFLDDVN